MSSSLDRKIEAAARRAAEERKTGAMSPEQFRGVHKNPDGTTTGVLPVPPARPVPAPTKTWLWNPPAGWYEADKPDTIYETVGDVRPLDDLSNVKATRTTIGKTHVDKDAPAVSPASDPLMKPKHQQWVRVLVDHFIDDNEPQPRTLFKTTDNQPPRDDMTNVRAVVAPGQVIEVWDGGFRVITDPPAQKPPLGLRPRYIAASQRLNEIDQAIHRYSEAGHTIPVEWEAERLQLVEYERARLNGVGDLPVHSANRVIQHSVQTEPDHAKQWQKAVLDAVEHVIGGFDQPNVVENAYKIAAHFMHQVFHIDTDSELNQPPKREPETDFPPFPFMGRDLGSAVDHTALIKRIKGHTLQMISFDELAEIKPEAFKAVLKNRRGKSHSWQANEFYHQMQRAMQDALLTGTGFISGGKCVDPKDVFLAPDEMPTGNFGQRTREDWATISLPIPFQPAENAMKPKDFKDTEGVDMTEATSPDAVAGHDQMRDRMAPSRDSNNMKWDPVATSRRLHQESENVGNGNSSNAYSDTGNADRR